MSVTFSDSPSSYVNLEPPQGWILREAIDRLIESGATDALDRIPEKRDGFGRFMLCDEVPLYTRLDVLPDDPTHVRLTVHSADDHPSPPTAEQIEWVKNEYARRFFWDVDMEAVRAALEQHPFGAELATRYSPIRPVNFADGWSALLKTVIANQIYPGLAIRLNQTLREQFGPRARFKGEWVYFYPYADVLAEIHPDQLRPLSFSRQKADYLPAIGDAVAANPDTYDWERLRHISPEETITTLLELHGVGKWTAHYVAMRGIAHPDIFVDEATIRKAVGIGSGLGEKINDSAFHKLTSVYAPYRTFACYYAYMAYYNAE
jgi:3-methyladenine DNA glycosylase/8-oxoguanine DNA glycosylase